MQYRSDATPSKRPASTGPGEVRALDKDRFIGAADCGAILEAQRCAGI
jgi:hypothetical protein